MQRLKVAVIFGGRSVEHDVSVVTAHQVMEALSSRHEVIPVYVTKDGDWLSGPGLNDLEVYRTKRWAEVGERVILPPAAGRGGFHVPSTGRLKAARTIPVDVAVPAIHGTNGEDGTLQGLLEIADVPYTGSGVVGSAVGMDKIAMKAVFKAADIPVLRHVVVETARLDVESDAVIEEIESEIGYPAFVKPSRLGSSVGIGKGEDRSSLLEALEVARRYDHKILVEPALEGCIEINTSVLGGNGRQVHASVCEQPLSLEGFLSFSDKYMRDAKSGGSKSDGMAAQDRRIPAPIADDLAERLQTNAVRAFKAVDAAGVARVDAFVREETGETWVMEINTVPGSFSFYLWEHSGMDFEALMDELLEIALAGHRRRSDLLFTFDSGMLDKKRGAKAGG